VSPSEPPPPPSEGAGEPAVGNILGLALLFRDRKALLSLPRRGLAPGLRVRDYEAEIPGVAFPLRGPLQAREFRHRRCIARHAILGIEARSIVPWLTARLVGRRLAGLAIRGVDLEIGQRLPGDAAPAGPCVLVDATDRGGARVGLVVALGLRTQGRLLRLSPIRRWLFGTVSTPSAELWAALGEALAPEIRVEPDGSLVIDPSRLALLQPFARAGWKAPDLSRLAIRSLGVDRRTLTVELDDAPATPDDAPPTGRAPDPIELALDRARDEIRGGAPDAAVLALLEQICMALEGLPGAQLAAIRWRVDVGGGDAEASIAALREWLGLQPGSEVARRLLVTRLALAGRDREVAQFLAAECRRDHAPAVQARHELALATWLVERLEDGRSALAVAVPLLARIRDTAELEPLLAEALVVLAQARVLDATRDGPRRTPHALAALDEALERLPHAQARAAARARVARTFARRGAPALALPLLSRALAEQPHDAELLDAAIEASLDAGETEAALELLRVRLAEAAPDDRGAVRMRLLGVAAGLRTDAAHAVLRTELTRALEADPDSEACLRMAADLAAAERDFAGAAEHLAHLHEVMGPDRARGPLALERARLLQRAGRIDQAWQALRTILEPDPWDEHTAPADVDRLDALEIGLDVAPPDERPRLVDALVTTARGQRRADALLARAAQAISVDDKLVDLWAALSDHERPLEVLAQIAPLIDEHDTDGLLSLADAASSLGDRGTECSSRARAARRLFQLGDAERAVVQLGRALELEPYRLDLQLALGEVLDALDRPRDALAHLRPLLDDDRAHRAGADPIDLARRCARLAGRLGLDDEATDCLRRALDRVTNDDPRRDAIADDLFGTYYRGGRTVEARELARAHLEHPEAARRATWMVRAAQLAEPKAGLELLRKAQRLRPLDDEIGDALEAALRATGAREELERHLVRRLEHPAPDGTRASLLARLIGTIEADPAAEDRAPELIQLLERLLSVVPHDADALFRLGALRRRLGNEPGACAAWSALPRLLAPTDPRIHEPALALARAAVTRGDAGEARELVRRALAVQPGDRTAFELLREIAIALADPAARLQAATGLLELASRPHERATLELECAEALIAQGDAAAAFVHLRRAAESSHGRGALDLQIAEVWLELARQRGDGEEEARARAQLRHALGNDLPLDELLAEVHLHADRLGRAGEVLALLESGLVRHDAEPRLLAVLERLAVADPGRCLQVLRSATEAMFEGPGRDRAATTLARWAHSRGELATALAALERLSEGAATTDEMLDLRSWATVGLGRERDELAEAEAALLRAPGSPLALARLDRLWGRDPGRLGAHLVRLAARGDGSAAGPIAAEAAARLLAAGDPDGLADAIELLARTGTLTAAQWKQYAVAVQQHDAPDRTARLIELAAEVRSVDPAFLGSSIDSVLDRALARHFDRTRLHRAAARWLGVPDPGRASDEELAPLLQRLDAIVDGQRLVGRARAGLWSTFAAGLAPALAARILRARALVWTDDPQARAALAEALGARRAWRELADVLAADPGTGPEAWRRLAQAASEDGSVGPAARARADLGEILARRGDHADAVVELERALEIDPSRIGTRYTLGRSLEALGRPAEALAQLLPLALGTDPPAPGVDLAELAHRCGRLALGQGETARAVELLSLARSRVAAGPLRRTIAEDLWTALERLGQDDDACRLCIAAADESDGADALSWLRRAAALAQGRARAELLERAAALDPDDQILDALDQTLQELGDRTTLVAFLRRRVDADRAAGRVDAAAVRALERLIESAIALSAVEPGEGPQTPELWRRLLAIAPTHDGALLAVARLELAAGHEREAIALFRRALAELAPADPRAVEPALAVGRAALAAEDLQTARDALERALAIRPGDRGALEAIAEVGTRMGDPELSLRAARGLLAHVDGPAPAASLERRAAAALEILGRDAEAAAALARAIEGVEVGTPAHLEVAESWLRVIRKAEPSPERDQAEARARAHLRRAMGPDLPTIDLLAEASHLADRLGRVEPAITLLEDAIARRPRDPDLFARLAELCARSEASDRMLRALRSLVDKVPAGASRDRLARQLALDARATSAARTVMHALDRISPTAAADPELLDAREWAVRALGRVEDELGRLEQALREGPREEVLVERLWRMLDDDALAGSQRLLALAHQADPAGRIWLARRALERLADRTPPATEAMLEAAAMLVDAREDPGPAFRALETSLLAADGSDPPPHLASLVELADRGARLGIRPLTGRAAHLLDEALARHPDHVPYHGLLLAQHGGEIDLALARIDSLARRHELDARARAALLLGLCDAVGGDAGPALLRRQALARVQERELFARILAAVRARGAWDLVADLLEARDARDGVDIAAWSALADAATDTPEVERRSRIRVGSWLLEHHDRAAVAQLRRALALGPPEPALREALSRALELAGDAAAALDALAPCIADAQHDALGTTPAELALRAGRLAERAERGTEAADLYERAFREAAHDSTRLTAATLLLPIARRLGRREVALRVAERCAEATAGPARATWLAAAADFAPEPDRPRLLAAAFELTPHDDALADALEAALRDQARTEDLELLLRRRLRDARASGVGDPAAVASILERVLDTIGSDRPADRREVLEQLVQVREPRAELRLELAAILVAAGERDAAAAHWLRVAEDLPDTDPRVLEPLRALAEWALARDELDAARRWLDRALALVPADLDLAATLLDVGVLLDDPATIVEAAQRLLRGASPRHAPAELHGRLAAAYERQGERERALEQTRRAAAASPAGSESHRTFAERWLRLAGEAGLEPERAVHEELAARSELRRAHGDALPGRLRLAEAALLVRAGRLDAARELLEEGAILDPAEPTLVAALEELAQNPGQARAVLASLDGLLRRVQEPARRRRLAERLARLARRLEEPAVGLRAVELVGDAGEMGPEWLELREWAVRSLNRVGAELAEIDDQLLSRPDARAIARLLRMLDGDGAACFARLTELAARAPGHAAAALAPAALAVVREHCPERLDLLVRALALVGAYAPAGELSRLWDGVETAALADGDADTIAALADLATARVQRGQHEFVERLDRILDRAVRDWPDAAFVDRGLWARAESTGARPRESYRQLLDELVTRANLRGRALARAHAGLAARLDGDELSRVIIARVAGLANDSEAVEAFVALLREAGAWDGVVTLIAARQPPPEAPELIALADEASAAAPVAAAAARRAAAGRLVARGEPALAVEQLELARAADPSPGLVRELGEALHAAGRPEEALACWSTLFDTREPDSDAVDARLAETIASIFAATGSPGRAADFFLRARVLESDPAVREALAARAFEQLRRLPDRRAQALALGRELVDTSSGEQRGTWLERAAEVAEAADRLELLREASALRPGDGSLADRLESALVELGRREELEALLERRLTEALESARSGDNGDEAIDIVHRLIPLLERDPGRRRDLGRLYDIVLRLEPDNVPALLVLAELRQETGELDEAVAHWIRAGELLPHDDDGFFEPACELCELLVSRSDLEDARIMAERALDIRPGDRRALQLLRTVGEHTHDARLRRRAVEGLLAHGPDDPQLELEAARASAELDDRPGALAAFGRAAGLCEPGSALQREVARAWVDAASVADRDAASPQDLEEEALAREQWRSALGGALQSSDLRAEALLLLQLGRPEGALALVDEHLQREPSDEIVLSLLKDVCVAMDQRPHYVAALQRAVAAVAPGEQRDRLATELAYAAVELEDAELILEVLARISAARATDPELLDLREWAVRKTGRVDAEVGALESELLRRPDDPAIHARLLRMLDDDVSACIRRLRAIAGTAPVEVATVLLEHALALALEREPPPLAPILELVAALLERGRAGPIATAWERLVDIALSQGEPDFLVALLGLAVDASAVHGRELGERVDVLLDEAVRRHPGAPPVVAVLARRIAAAEPGASSDALVERVRRIAHDYGLRGAALGRTWSGVADRLDRASAAALLSRCAQEVVESDPEGFRALVDALEARNHWPEVVRLLEQRVSGTPDPRVKVATLKHLAHVGADILGDRGAAIGYLGRALELSPEDPDLLLPLLDHHYERSQLDRVIELSIRVMEHVPMGDAAFVALGHRAADAALAHGDHRFAESLLRRVVRRCPDDLKTKTRLDELEVLADDPDHRCRMLQVIAQRQAGSARIEALEERAKLLVDPLLRLDEAIGELETVLAEAPERRDSQLLLQHLYERRERWADLAVLLERLFGRQAGIARSRTLRRLAGVYRERLMDPARAEQTLRLALETLGTSADERALADELQHELVEVLERQGRYAEIVSHLRRELAEELGDELAMDAASQRRVELLGHLARVLRDYIDDEPAAARVYERLEKVGRLPEDGLATLARGYRNQHRHADLVRVLIARSEALATAGDLERKAEVDQRIGDLLEGPLRRPHEAARFYLDAYLANPFENTIAGQRARVLLAGTDSVVNVRKLLLERIQRTEEAYYPLALTLLADLLAPHEEHEEEAETRYRMALKMEAGLAPALEGLGRLLARAGRVGEAVEPLVRAARSADLDPERAADDAATAARALQELGRPEEAESILRHALGRAPDAQRCLLELARLYGRLGRKDDEAHVLDELSALSLSSMLRAEVAFRRAMLLEREFRADPFSEAGELGRTYLLEAVGSDAMHAQARQVLLDLATARSEWSIVAHMLFLTIRELPPGPQRALTHLDLAGVYLERLADAESALRNLASALKQPTDDPIVLRKVLVLAERFADPGRVAQRLEHAATNDPEVDDLVRIRLYTVVAESHRRAGNVAAAHRAAQIASGAGATATLAEPAPDDANAELRRERDALSLLLDSEEQQVERLHILGRLREIGRALDDAHLVQRTSAAQLELAHGLLESEADRDEAAAALFELLAERGDYGQIVALYEGLADRTPDAARAAKLLTDAARFAWTGQRDAALAMAIVRRALVRRTRDPEATALLVEIAVGSDDPGADQAIYDELSGMEPSHRSPALSLRLASAALRLGRDEEGRRLVFDLLQTPLSPDLRLSALGLLDGILTRAGLTRDRVPVLEERLRATRGLWPERAADVALELATVQARIGALDQARLCCRTALAEAPDHAGLVRLHAELLERAEDWTGLAAALETLGDVSLDEGERAKWLTRAAQVNLEHPSDGATAMSAARRLLEKACRQAPTRPEPRSLLLPLAFAERRWEEVLDLSVQLRSHSGDGDEALVLGALAEALLQGSKAIARSVGPRHDPNVRARLLWPALANLLDVLVERGPLPRLDAILGAAAALAGGNEDLHAQLHAWASGSPLRAGITLALARSNEAMGRANMARHLYQLAAFLAPGGALAPLVERLPDVELPDDPLREESWVPLEHRSALRELLIQLRTFTAGVRGPGGTVAAPGNAIERAALNAAARPAARWRERLGFLIPLRLTQDPLTGGCGVRNEADPTIVVNEEFASTPPAERTHRLAQAVADIATGTAMLVDTHPMPLAGLLDALAQLAIPGHEPRSRGAQVIADTFAARGLRAGKLPTDLRARLAKELEHWLQQPGALSQLSIIIRRSSLLFAVRLSGHLDGALLAMARDRDLLDEGDVLDGRRVLETEDAQWLLRTLGIFGGDPR
jgi:tetratricopeptide (TPR) repeat protein